MDATVLQCLKQAAGELGLPVPPSAVASTDEQAVQMLALFNSAGNELVRMYEWQFLRKTATITLVEGQSRYPLTSDFSKLINQTLWETNNVNSVFGEVTPRQWAYLNNSSTVVPEYCFIIKNRAFEFAPVPSATNSTLGDITYEYISNGWLSSYDIPNTYLNFAQSDLDVIQFDFWLIVKLLKLKMWEAKGLDTAALADDFNRYFANATGQDHGAPVLSLVNGYSSLPPLGIPSTGYGQ